MASTVVSRATRATRFIRSPWPLLSRSSAVKEPPVATASFSSLTTTATTNTTTSSYVASASPNPWSQKLNALFPAAFLLGAFGVGTLDYCYADSVEEGRDPLSNTASDSLDNAAKAEILVDSTKRRLEGLMSSKGMQAGSYPPFTVAAKGQKITIKFKVPLTCEISRVIVDLVTHLGLKIEPDGGGAEMVLRAWNSTAAWQVTLNPLEKIKEVIGKNHDNDFCILIFESLVGSEYREVEFMKREKFTHEELDAVVSALKLAGERTNIKKATGQTPKGNISKGNYNHGDSQLHSVEKSVSALEAIGVRVYGCDETSGVPADGIISWDRIVGYDKQKREIEDTILLALQNPDIYDGIAHGTRCNFETNRPRAVLFEGPPGTGKTSSARVIAKQAGIPLVYVPLEVIMSKYYGESERLLGKVFSLANDLPNGAIIFLDEVDSFAVARDSETHEATRRILSVILRQIDGFDQEKQVVVIAATNRKQDLDPALLSRFDSTILFPLPDQQAREDIAAYYAKHLKKSELVLLASATEEMSGRDIRDICQQAERHWASKIIRGQAPKDVEGGLNLPPVQEYILCAEQRREASLVSTGRGTALRGRSLAVV